MLYFVLGLSMTIRYTSKQKSKKLSLFSKHVTLILVGPLVLQLYPQISGSCLRHMALFIALVQQEWQSDLQTLHENVFTNAELTITEIEDLEMLKILRSIEISGFGTSENVAQNYYDSYANSGFGDGTPWHHYIGWLHREPVAIASLLLHAGVAGIYGVATIPQSRRQGVAAAMTLHALREARKLGYRIAVLSPTEMSDALYRRIGFQEYCKLLHYDWSAET